MPVIVLHAFENMVYIKDSYYNLPITNARLDELLFKINQNKQS